MEIIFAIIIFGVLLLAIVAYVRSVFKRHREDKALEALFQLREARSEEAVKSNFHALKSEFASVRRSTASMLGEIPDRRALEPLISLALEDKEFSVQEAAVTSLGELSDMRALETLVIIALKNASPLNQRAALCAIEKIGESNSVKVDDLTQLLDQNIYDHYDLNVDYENMEKRRKFVDRYKTEEDFVIRALEKSKEIIHRFTSAKESIRIQIPYITQQLLRIDLVDGGDLSSKADPGEKLLQQAIHSHNQQRFDEAAIYFEQALKKGIAPLRQGYAMAELGEIMIRRGNIEGAIEQFLRVLSFDEALYESVHHASQYLSIILSEVGRTEEANALQNLAFKTQTHLGYSLSQSAAESVRNLVRSRWQISSP